MEVRTCEICGTEYPEVDMRRISTGRNAHYICMKCARKGHKQVSTVFYRPGRYAQKKVEEKKL